jgi:hypothetical protein
MELNPEAQKFYLLYHPQAGGALYPVFRGSRQAQYGEGFGDMFKSIWKWVFPVVSSSAGTFLQEMVKSKSEGSNWKDAAKAATKPTIFEGISRGAEQVSKALDQAKSSQEGMGRRKKRHRKNSKRVYKGIQKALSSELSKLPKYNF